MGKIKAKIMKLKVFIDDSERALVECYGNELKWNHRQANNDQLKFKKRIAGKVITNYRCNDHKS